MSTLCGDGTVGQQKLEQPFKGVWVGFKLTKKYLPTPRSLALKNKSHRDVLLSTLPTLYTLGAVPA